MKYLITIICLLYLNLSAQDTVFVKGTPRNITIIFTGLDTIQTPQDTLQDTLTEEPQDTISQNDTQTYTIMAIGDSNTEGYGFAGSYRQALDSLLGSRYDFVGRKTNGSFTDNQHEGYSGADINSIKHDQVLFGGMFTNGRKADVIVLMIGTNDVNDVNGVSPNNDPIAYAPERYRDLVVEIQRKDTGAKIICVSLLPIFSNQWGNGNKAKVDTFNRRASYYIQRNAKAGTKVFWLDVNSNFSSSDFIDGLHLNKDAYRRLGALIYGAVKNIE